MLIKHEKIQELGLRPKLKTVSKSHPAAKNRFIYYPDRLSRAPNSLRSAISASFSSTSPFSGLLSSVAKEPFQPRSQAADESVDSFVSRRLGPQFATNVLSALVHGIYAGDTRQLSMKAVFPSLWNMEAEKGGIIKSMLTGGTRKNPVEVQALKDITSRLGELASSMKDVSIYSLQGGLGELPNALVKHLTRLPNVELRQKCFAKKLEHKSGGFEVREIDSLVRLLETDYDTSYSSRHHPIHSSQTTSSRLFRRLLYRQSSRYRI